MDLSLLSESAERIFIKAVTENFGESINRIPGYVTLLSHFEAAAASNTINKTKKRIEKYQEYLKAHPDPNDEYHKHILSEIPELQNSIEYTLEQIEQHGDWVDSDYGKYIYQIDYRGPIVYTPWDIHTNSCHSGSDVNEWKMDMDDWKRVISAPTKEEGYELYKKLGYPTKDEEYARDKKDFLFECHIVRTPPAIIENDNIYEGVINVPCDWYLLADGHVDPDQFDPEYDQDILDSPEEMDKWPYAKIPLDQLRRNIRR